MPEKRTVKRTRRTLRQAKAPMTLAGDIGMGRGRRPAKRAAKTRVVIEREPSRAKKPRLAAARRSRSAPLAPKRVTRKAASPRAVPRRASAKRRSRAKSMR